MVQYKDMNPQLKNPKFYLMIVSDVCLFAAALYLSYLIRFEFTLESFYAAQIPTLLLWVIPLKLAVFLVGGLYRGCLLYTSDAADDLLCVDLGGTRIINKKK